MDKDNNKDNNEKPNLSVVDGDKDVKKEESLPTMASREDNGIKDAKDFVKEEGEKVKGEEEQPLPPATIVGLNKRSARILRTDMAFPITPGNFADGYQAGIKRVPYGVWHGMMGRPLTLFKYVDVASGQDLYLEDVQLHTWNGQPEVFLALKTSPTKGLEWIKDTLWTEEEINKHLGI